MDNDVQKLHNRIRMLQLEEDKALKKIEETRKKAKKMLRNSTDRVRPEQYSTPNQLFIERKLE